MASADEWYVAVLVVECQVAGDATDEPTVDLQARLVRARDPEHAYQRALELGATAAHSYSNESGQRVSWEFRGLHTLERLMNQDIAHGTEVYSRIVHEPPEQFVMPKEDLWEFWFKENQHRTAREVLEDE